MVPGISTLKKFNLGNKYELTQREFLNFLNII
jgi:hypothetical protein